MIINDESTQSKDSMNKLQGIKEIIRRFPEVIYVADPKTYEVILVNDLFAQAIGEDPVGKKCYKAFQNLDEPCPFCTNDIIAKSDEPYIWEFYNENLDRHYYISDQMVPWPDGRNVRFEVAIDITEKVKATQERNKNALQLQERIKELHCMTSISLLLADVETDFDQAMQHIVDLIPESWQFPERTSAKITFDGQTFSSSNLKEGEIRQIVKIVLPDEERNGKIEVFYHDERESVVGEPFLKEEEVLLKSIAREIRKFILRKRDLEELVQHKEKLEMLVSKRTADLQRANNKIELEMSESNRRADIIKQQAEDILELSTPVMQVWDGVLLAPLIGNLDSRRAQNFMEVLLNSVAKDNAEVAIIDITGVGIIDTETGRNVLETISAIGLLGAQVILTGVRATVAQTLVHLGVDLSAIETCSSLKSGLQLALSKRMKNGASRIAGGKDVG